MALVVNLIIRHLSLVYSAIQLLRWSRQVGIEILIDRDSWQLIVVPFSIVNQERPSFCAVFLLKNINTITNLNIITMDVK